MKGIPLFLLCLAGLGSSVSAEDIRLQDGRVIADCRVVSQTARKVVLLQGKRMISVPKELLPEALRKQYPVDLNQEAQEQAKAEEARKVAIAEASAAKLRRAENEKRAQKELELEEQQKLLVEQKRRKAISVGSSLVQDYVRSSRGSIMGGTSTYAVTVQEAQPRDSNLSTWTLSGLVTVRNTRDLSRFGTSEERAKYLADDKTLSARELRMRRADMEYIGTDCYRFTATLEDLDGDPKASVWVN